MTMRLQLSGVLDFESVPSVWKDMVHSLSEASAIQLDLSAVTHCNSAALALLVAIVQEAGKHHQSVFMAHVPARLMEIAAACGIREWIEDMSP